MSLLLTWANYALIVIICLGIYYAIVGFIFYRPNVKIASLDEGRNTTTELESADNTLADTKRRNLFGEEEIEETTIQVEDPNFNPEAQDFTDEIVAFTSSCNEDVSKESLIQSLKRITQKYPSLKNGEQRYELNQLIAISTENYCSIHFSADELSELWKS